MLRGRRGSLPVRRATHVIAAIITVAVSGAGGRPAFAERLPVRVYTSVDGLGHDRVNKIVRDAHGFLWFCIPGGLSRFDGHRFVTYRQEAGLTVESINDLLEDSDGGYWVATNGGGVAHFDSHMASGVMAPGRPPSDAHRRIIMMRVGDDPAANRVNVLYRDRAGQLLAGTDGGLFAIGDQPFARVPLRIPAHGDGDVQVWAMFEDRLGSLWIGTSHGVVRRLSGGTTEWLPVNPQGGVDHVWAILQDRDDRMWLGHETGLFSLAREAATRSMPSPTAQRSAGQFAANEFHADRRVSGRVYALQAAQGGGLWVGGVSGLALLDPVSVHAYGSETGIPWPLVRALGEDSAGNLWVGTVAGAGRIARHGFTTFTLADGLAESDVGAIVETRSGELCAINRHPFINVFDGRRFHTIRPNLPDAAFHGDSSGSGIALQDRDGEWWIPFRDSLYRFGPTRALDELSRARPRAIYTPQNGLAGGPITALFEDSRGDIWITNTETAPSPVTKFDRRSGSFVQFSQADALPSHDRVRSFAEDRAGNVWLGFWNGGLARFNGRRFESYAREGTTDWQSYGHAVLLDDHGRLWISAAQGNELRRIDDPTTASPEIVAHRGLAGSERSVVLMVEDGYGRLYVRTTRGLIRLDPDSGRTKLYTTADGLAMLEPSAALRDRSGALWFASRAGVSRLVPEADRRAAPPSAAIGAIVIDGAAQPISDLGETAAPSVTLGPNDRQVVIEFLTIDFEPGEVVRYQFKLEGLDRDWSRPSDADAVTYAYLRPGQYRFAVRAATADGDGVEQQATVALTVLAPIWRRSWFIALVAALAVAAIHAIYRVRLKRLLELERVRMSIASDLHDEIGSGLSRLAIMSDVVAHRLSTTEREPLRLLNEVSSTARRLVDAMGDIVWAINPRDDHLGSVVVRINSFAAEVLEPNGIEYRFDVAPNAEEERLSPDQRRQLLLILKEAIVNVAHHSECRRASLRVAVERERLRIVLEDDGRGFAPDLVVTKGRRGLGLDSMHRRAVAVGGCLDVEAVPTGGTRVVLTLPLGT